MRDISFSNKFMQNQSGLLITCALTSICTAVVVYAFYLAPMLGAWLVIFLMLGAIFVLVSKLPTVNHTDGRLGIWFVFLFVFFAIVWPRYALLRLPGLPGLSPARLFQGILTIYWLYIISKNSGYKLVLKNRIDENKKFFVALLVLMFFKFFSVFFSELPLVSIKGFLNELLSVYFPIFACLTFVRNNNDVRLVLFAFFIGAIAVIGFGVVEYFLNHNVVMGFLDVDSDYVKQILAEKIRAGSYRLQSTFSHPLTFSEFMVVSAPIGAIFIRRLFWNRFLYLFLFILFISACAFFVVKSGSRSGVGALLLGVGLYFVLCSARQLVISRDRVTTVSNLFFILLYISFLILGIYFIQDIIAGKTTRELNSALVRLDMWSRGIKMALDQPLFGYGQDMAALTLGFVEGDGNITIDSYYLSILLESGFFSLICYLFLILYVFVKGVRFGFGEDENGQLAFAITVSVICFLVIKSILSLTHNHGVFMVLFSLIFAITSRHFGIMLVRSKG